MSLADQSLEVGTIDFLLIYCGPYAQSFMADMDVPVEWCEEISVSLYKI